MPIVDVRVQEAEFDAGAELVRLEALGGGGVASFTGVVRGGGGLTGLLLEHHAAMTQGAIARIADDAAGRWPLLGITIVHRVGLIPVGGRIVFVGTASAHRAAALAACAFLIDWTKTRAPFWKQEQFDDGRRLWVEARADDDAAAGRWDDGRA